MRPRALFSELPPNTIPISAVNTSGTMRLISHGSGLRMARRKSLASSTRSMVSGTGVPPMSFC